jgi:hypothetical protein
MRGDVREPHRFIQNRSRTSVAALKSKAAAEKSKNQLSRDFRVVGFSTFATKSAISRLMQHSNRIVNPGLPNNRKWCIILTRATCRITIGLSLEDRKEFREGGACA